MKIKGRIENESYSVKQIDLKNILKIFLAPKLAHSAPKKDPKIRSRWKVRFEESIEKKVVYLYEYTTFLIFPQPQKEPIEGPKSKK